MPEIHALPTATPGYGQASDFYRETFVNYIGNDALKALVGTYLLSRYIMPYTATDIADDLALLRGDGGWAPTPQAVKYYCEQHIVPSGLAVDMSDPSRRAVSVPHYFQTTADPYNQSRFLAGCGVTLGVEADCKGFSVALLGSTGTTPMRRPPILRYRAMEALAASPQPMAYDDLLKQMAGVQWSVVAARTNLKALIAAGVIAVEQPFGRPRTVCLQGEAGEGARTMVSRFAALNDHRNVILLCRRAIKFVDARHSARTLPPLLDRIHGAQVTLAEARARILRIVHELEQANVPAVELALGGARSRKSITGDLRALVKQGKLACNSVKPGRYEYVLTTTGLAEVAGDPNAAGSADHAGD